MSHAMDRAVARVCDALHAARTNPKAMACRAEWPALFGALDALETVAQGAGLAPSPPAPPGVYIVPRGTRAKRCDGKNCDTMLYFVRTPHDRIVPVDCEGDGLYDPTADRDGLGQSHFKTCTEPDRFSRRKATT